MIKDSDEEIEKIEEQYPILKNVKDIDKLEKMLRCFKDADKLDRVRLSPDGHDLYEGLDASRLLLDSSKELEGLAYESLDKLLRILDIERERKELEQYLGLEEELSRVPQIEEEIDNQIERGKSATEEKLTAIVNQSVKKVDIRELPRKIKSFFMGLFRKTEMQNSKQDNSREDETYE